MGRSWAAALLLVVSCVGPTDGSGDSTADRPRMCDGNFFCVPPEDCDPLRPPGSQGCANDRKCTWVVMQLEPVRLGAVECVADGTVPLGGACTQPALGVGDECVAGTICSRGECRDICGFDGRPEAACSDGASCMRQDGMFSNGDDDPVAGMCSPSCDPLTQLRDDGLPCLEGEGCYVMVSTVDTIAVCASAGTVAVGEAIPGGAFANTCVPGAQPRRRAPDSSTIECGGLCRPTNVTSASTASEGGVAPDDCQGRWGAPAPDDDTAGESCRYFHSREPVETTTPFSNTVGWCFSHARFAEARCIDLPPGMESVGLGCTAMTSPAPAPGGSSTPMRLDRLQATP